MTIDLDVNILRDSVCQYLKWNVTVLIPCYEEVLLNNLNNLNYVKDQTTATVIHILTPNSIYWFCSFNIFKKIPSIPKQA